MSTPPRRKGRPKAFNATPSQTTIQALDRGLDVLEAVAQNTGMTLTGVSDALDQSPATIYRVLSTLEARDMVEVDPQDQSWHIGPMAFRLGSAFLRRSGVVERSRAVMRSLMEDTGETSNLGIEKGGDVMFVSQVETHESIRAFFPPGTVSPMHASGIGKALLSQFSEPALDRFLDHGALERFTERTICDPYTLKADLALIRSRGFAFDDEEKATGMRCVAAPILNSHGEAIAGISVSGPSTRMSRDRIDRIGALVRDGAAQVSRAIGAPQPMSAVGIDPV